MDSNLIYTNTLNMTYEEWLYFRKKGIGASEVSTLLGLNPYKSSFELFHEKISPYLDNKVENIAMFLGKETEDFIAKLWQYYDGTEEGLIKNYRAKIKYRKCEKVNSYIQNPLFDFLFCSLDRKMNKHYDEYNKLQRDEGALEIKNMSGYAVNMYENGIPPMHLIQVNAQMLICGFKYGELAIFQDGRKLNVYPFEFQEDLANHILVETREFWEKVKEGKEIFSKIEYNRMRGNNIALEKLQIRLSELEPEVDSSLALSKFLKEKFNIIDRPMREGTEKELKVFQENKRINEKLKLVQKEKIKNENEIKNIIQTSEGLKFGENGYCTYFADKNGNRRLNNKVIYV